MGSFEDMLARWEGLSEEQIAKVHQALADVEHLAGVADKAVASVEAQITAAMVAIKAQVVELDVLKATFDAELPRIKRTIATVQNVVATVNAKQRQWNR